MIPARKPLPLPLPLPLPMSPLPSQDRSAKPFKKALPKKSARLLKRVVVLFLVAGMMAATVVYRHAQIAVNERSIARLAAEISEMEEANARLQVAALELSSLSRIERVARQELGMTHPAGSQILRVGVNGGN